MGEAHDLPLLSTPDGGLGMGTGGSEACTSHGISGKTMAATVPVLGWQYLGAFRGRLAGANLPSTLNPGTEHLLAQRCSHLEIIQSVGLWEGGIDFPTRAEAQSSGLAAGRKRRHPAAGGMFQNTLPSSRAGTLDASEGLHGPHKCSMLEGE